MYTILKASGVTFGIAKQWQSINLDNFTMIQLYATFRKVYITLSQENVVSKVYLDIDAIRPQFSSYSGKMQDIINGLGGASLPTINSVPSTDIHTAKYSDAFKAKYKVTPIHHLYGQNVIPDLRTSALLTRDNVDYVEFRNKCLVSINGYYHLTSTDGVSGITVIDAMKSLRKSGQNQIGIYSFEKVANLTIVPIVPSMVAKRNSSSTYFEYTQIQIPQSLQDKSVLLVLGGYLFAPDQNQFARISDNVFTIDFQNLSLIERYYESSHYLDLSSLPVAIGNIDHSQIGINDFISDANLLAYMTLSQSFFVVLDTPELFINRQSVKKTRSPGQYLTYRKPIYPLVTGLGRMPEYWSQYEDGVYSLRVYDNHIENLIYKTVNTAFISTASNAILPSNPANISSAEFIEIGIGY